MLHFTLLRGQRKETVLVNSLLSYLTKEIQNVRNGSMIVVPSYISSQLKFLKFRL